MARALLLSVLAVAALCVAPAAAVKVGVQQHVAVTGATPAETLAKNADLYAQAAQRAAAAGAALLVFPEFGLFGGQDWTKSCLGPAVPSPYCQPLNGSVVQQLAAAAKQNRIALSVNLCEEALGDGKLANFNTQVVLAPNGTLAAVYRKTHPFFGTCFTTPPQPDIVVTQTAGLQAGIFTCADILYKEPAASLLARGVRTFLYSASIPSVGGDAEQLFSLEHKAVMIASNLAAKQSGIYAAGVKLAGPKTSGPELVVADIPAA